MKNDVLFGAAACLLAVLLVLASEYFLHDQLDASLAYLRAARGGLQPDYQTLAQYDTMALTATPAAPVPNFSYPGGSSNSVWQPPQQPCLMLRRQLDALQRQYNMLSQRVNNLQLRSDIDARRGDHAGLSNIQNFVINWNKI